MNHSYSQSLVYFSFDEEPDISSNMSKLNFGDGLRQRFHYDHSKSMSRRNCPLHSDITARKDNIPQDFDSVCSSCFTEEHTRSPLKSRMSTSARCASQAFSVFFLMLYSLLGPLFFLAVILLSVSEFVVNVMKVKGQGRRSNH
mmetsp:Transcript_5289/g.9715  ORF Transcript_5289/g.9715 Transcript_5289/m.9715 type:complete len:143 (+) Transcript_5289:212-640(+)